jgi:hypothetical protein
MNKDRLVPNNRKTYASLMPIVRAIVSTEVPCSPAVPNVAAAAARISARRCSAVLRTVNGASLVSTSLH